jgi:hypothetical protein
VYQLGSISADVDLVSGASISAVNWNADPNPTSLNLQIRVVSFDAEGDLIATSFDHNDDGWDDTPTKITTNYMKATAMGTNVVAAVQGPDTDGTGRMDIFYQPVGIIGQLTSKTTALNSPTSFEVGVGVVVMNDAGKLERYKAQYSETSLLK